MQSFNLETFSSLIKQYLLEWNDNQLTHETN
jgi:hypothetical protein